MAEVHTELEARFGEYLYIIAICIPQLNTRKRSFPMAEASLFALRLQQPQILHKKAKSMRDW